MKDTAELPCNAKLADIEDTVNQAMSALDKIENYLSDQSRSTENAAILEEKAIDLKGRMEEGEQQSRNAYDIIKAASSDLEKITDMAKMINQISEQTHVLSINAAIESAHAGEAGKGFAVVAAEIRKLAESTKVNANNIQSVLLSISRQIGGALKASEISSLSFAELTGEITAIAGSLENSAEKARLSGITAAETVTLSYTGKPENKPSDISVLTYSLGSALKKIQSLCALIKASSCPQSPAELETIPDSIVTYPNETTEPLELLPVDTVPAEPVKNESISLRFISKKEMKTEIKNKDFPLHNENTSQGLASGPAASQLLSDGTTVAAARLLSNGNSAAEAEQSSRKDPSEQAESQFNEIDNSWRKDVDVKEAPKTVF